MNVLALDFTALLVNLMIKIGFDAKKFIVFFFLKTIRDIRVLKKKNRTNFKHSIFILKNI